MKPLLAADYDESKIVFPIGVQAKIDGVRGLTTGGQLTGRSLKKHKNLYTTAFYSKPEYADFDGELAAGPDTHPDLCRMTSSAVGTIVGEPFTLFHVFDSLHKNVVTGQYIDRYKWLEAFLRHQWKQGLCVNARLVPMRTARNIDELREFHNDHMQAGYEGTILRNLHGLYKEGRSTVRKGELLRIKDFVDAEFKITGITEGDENQNEAQINELGQTFRTSHQDNKVPNGMVGSFQGILLKDIIDKHSKKLLLAKGLEITVSPGELSHETRKLYFQQQNLAVGQIGKFKFFPKGLKDKPRFPIFTGFRSEEDL